jgi:hypothetical protein
MGFRRIFANVLADHWAWNRTLQLVASLAATISAAALSWKYFESPILSFISTRKAICKKRRRLKQNPPYAFFYLQSLNLKDTKCDCQLYPPSLYSWVYHMVQSLLGSTLIEL